MTLLGSPGLMQSARRVSTTIRIRLGGSSRLALHPGSGHVAIDSVVGRGTTIEMFLPRDSTTAGDAQAEERAGEPPLGRGEVVLVIEDDPSVRAFAVKILERLGYVARQSESAEAALEILRSYPRIDLLMSDLVLRGGMSGIDLAIEVAEFRSDLPVLLVSGYAPESFENSHEAKSRTSFVLNFETQKRANVKLQGPLKKAMRVR